MLQRMCGQRTAGHVTKDHSHALGSLDEPDGATYFAYNDADLVSHAHLAGGAHTYFYYDGLLRRYAMEHAGATTYFQWDSNGLNLLTERDAAGNVTAEYTHGHAPIPGIGTAQTARKLDNGTPHYQYPIKDHRGTVHKLLDENETVVGTYEYDAFGRPILTQEDATTQALGNRLRYQTNWLVLPGSKGRFSVSRTRTYDAQLGRFLQRDPLVQPTGARVYTAIGIPYCSDQTGTHHYAHELAPITLRPVSAVNPSREKGRRRGLSERLLISAHSSLIIREGVLYAYAFDSPICTVDPWGLTVANCCPDCYKTWVRNFRISDIHITKGGQSPSQAEATRAATEALSKGKKIIEFLQLLRAAAGHMANPNLTGSAAMAASGAEVAASEAQSAVEGWPPSPQFFEEVFGKIVASEHGYWLTLSITWDVCKQEPCTDDKSKKVWVWSGTHTELFPCTEWWDMKWQGGADGRYSTKQEAIAAILPCHQQAVARWNKTQDVH